MQRLMLGLLFFIEFTFAQFLPGFDEFSFGMKCMDLQQLLVVKKVNQLPSSVGSCESNVFFDYPWMGSEYLATIQYKNQQMNGFVLLKQDGVSQSQLLKSLDRFIKSIQPRYGLPDKAMVLNDFKVNKEQFPSGISVDIAQWTYQKELYKLSVLRSEQVYTWSFSGVKTK